MTTVTVSKLDDLHERPAPGAEIVRLHAGTLFERVCIELPQTARAGFEAPPMMTYRDPRSGWTVHCPFPVPAQTPKAERYDNDQLFFTFASPAGTVTPMISPACASFMNATVRGIFRDTHMQCKAAARLMRHDILYLGDLTGYSRNDVIARLGPYGGFIEDIEAKLQDLGLGFSTPVSWWTRPALYYRETR